MIAMKFELHFTRQFCDHFGKYGHTVLEQNQQNSCNQGDGYFGDDDIV